MENYTKVNRVRAIIDLFENHQKIDSSTRLNRPMSKSFTGLSDLERKYNNNTYTIQVSFQDIEDKLTSLIGRIGKYRFYAKEVHIILHNELTDILDNLFKLEILNNNASTYNKKELIKIVRVQFDLLNDKLPGFSGTESMKIFEDLTYIPFSSAAKKESLFRGRSENISAPLIMSDASDTSDTFHSSIPQQSTTLRSPLLIGGYSGTRHSPAPKKTTVSSHNQNKVNGKMNDTVQSSVKVKQGIPSPLIIQRDETSIPQYPVYIPKYNVLQRSPSILENIVETRDEIVVPKSPHIIIGGTFGTRQYYGEEVFESLAGVSAVPQTPQILEGKSLPPKFQRSDEPMIDIAERTRFFEEMSEPRRSFERYGGPGCAKKTLIIGGFNGGKLISGSEATSTVFNSKSTPANPSPLETLRKQESVNVVTEVPNARTPELAEQEDCRVDEECSAEYVSDGSQSVSDLKKIFEFPDTDRTNIASLEPLKAIINGFDVNEANRLSVTNIDDGEYESDSFSEEDEEVFSDGVDVENNNVEKRNFILSRTKSSPGSRQQEVNKPILRHSVGDFDYEVRERETGRTVDEDELCSDSSRYSEYVDAMN